MEGVFIVIFLLLSVNLLAYVLYGVDKRKAQSSRPRIPEAALLLIALGGGALGALLGMYCHRHKTRHIKFVLLVPLFLIIQLFVLYKIVA